MRQEVSYDGEETPGTIIVDTRARLLYLVLGSGRAVRYGVGVGRPGFTWSGVHHVSHMREWPDWTPPDEMLRRQPDLPRHMVGGPSNPLGARALYLGYALSHPRLKRTVDHRHPGIFGLHPHAQRRRDRPV
jgi:lipoprotein-anchoring transpeptidase ErfK/SrfK